MPNNYQRGSIWRKWDLHIHTPKSLYQEYGGDNPQVWDEFIRSIAELPPEIKVIGVTDYLFIDGYEYLISRRNEIPNIELIIPIIEFRLNTFSGTTNNTKRHNFHVLFDPLSVDVAHIREQLLNCLSTGYRIEDNSIWQQTPTYRSLEELGRQIKRSAPPGNTVHHKTDLQVGFDNITYIRGDILANLAKDCFQGKHLIAIGYSEWDQSRWDQSAAEKRSLINDAHFALTNLSDVSKIAENVEDLKVNKLKSLVLHSSDSHKFEQLHNSLLWIKADPTFAGLKQIINEPERVFIGEEPPNYKHSHQIISKISIPTSKGWFPDNFELNLNRDLVSIIGGRGSGKSALAEMIAYGAGGQDINEEAFLKKASQHADTINGTDVKLTWEDGTNTGFRIGSLSEDHGLIRYLSQRAVEQLCSPSNSRKLVEQIENVIFQALDESEKMGASNFKELRTRVLSGFKFEKDKILEKIKGINKEINTLLDIIDSIPEKQKQITAKKVDLEKLTSSLPELPPEDKIAQEELASLLNLKKLFEENIVDLQSILTNIAGVDAKVKIIELEIASYADEIVAMLSNIGIENTTETKITVNMGKIKELLLNKRIEITTKIDGLKNGSKVKSTALLGQGKIDTILSKENSILPYDNLISLNIGIEEIQKKTHTYETSKMKYQKQKRLISETASSIKAIEEEVTKINTQILPACNRLKDQRMDIYCSYFAVLANEKIEIEKLYRPLQESLLAGTDTDRRLDFEAIFSYELENHYSQGINIIDRTRKGNFREQYSLKMALSDLWEVYCKGSFNHDEIKRAIRDLLIKFLHYEEKDILIQEQLRESYNLEHFDNWFYDTSHFSIVSSLKFDGTDLYLLSPGQKGIVLLMLYLEIDKGDYRPLIIDQPEENLDNLSVYKDLINYFRDRKQYRQIIIVTHNPNLVVNTDTEQIIVAKYDGGKKPRLEYAAGSLEDQAKTISAANPEEMEDGIIEKVCDILEGGDNAFNKRKRKYEISSKKFKRG